MPTKTHIQKAVPYGRFPDYYTFKQKVEMLRLPYYPLTEAQYRFLENHPSGADVFLIGGVAMTFGTLGDTKELMPILPDKIPLLERC